MLQRALFQAELLGIATLLSGCLGAASNGAMAPGGSALLPSTRVDSAAPAFRRERQVLFIATLGAAVGRISADIHTKNPESFGPITQGISRSQGVWVDRNGTLYVSNNTTPPSVVEYKRGQTTPFKTITNGLFIPGSIAVDSTLTLYVADNQPAPVILIYPPGAGSPSQTIQIPQVGRQQPGGIALDPKGELIVACFDIEHNDGTVYSIARGSTQPKNLGLQGLPGSALGVDKAGNIYVGGNEGDISVFAPGSTTPSRYISTGNVSGFYSDFAVTPNGTIYWPNFDSVGIYEFAPGASGPTNVVNGSGVDAAVGPL